MVVIATSPLEFFFYVSIVSATTTSYECLYQTPISFSFGRSFIATPARAVVSETRSHLQVDPELGGGLASWFEGSIGPTILPGPRRPGRVSSVKRWFVSERKKPADPGASTAATPINNTGGLVRKTTSISSFHSALSGLGVGPGLLATTDTFAPQQLNQGTAAKPVSTIPASPTGAVPNRAIIEAFSAGSMTVPLFYERRSGLGGIHPGFASA